MKSYQDLIQYFEINNSQSYYENIKLWDIETEYEIWHNQFSEFFHEIYYFDTLNMLEDIIAFDISSHQNEISFYTNYRRLEEYCHQEIMKLREQYLKNPFSQFISVNNFHSEIYSKDVYERIFSWYYNNNGNILKDWYYKYSTKIENGISFHDLEDLENNKTFEEINSELSEFAMDPGHYKSKNVFHLQKFYDLFEPKMDELFELLQILSKIKIYKITLEAESFKSNKITTLIERSQEPPLELNKYPLVFSSKLSFNFFMYCMSKYKNERVKPPLFAKYYLLFKEENYIIGHKLESFIDFVEIEFHLKPSRPRPDKSLHPECEEFDNYKDNFLKVNGIVDFK
ncbi:hypothetical protein ACKGJN_06230 [Gillisia sp. Q332]|uniref:hypothetical protein n=1 Tax=Gillisia xinjiangensis TaxID=3384765 RepID=UPI003919E05A